MRRSPRAPGLALGLSLIALVAACTSERSGESGAGGTGTTGSAGTGNAAGSSGGGAGVGGVAGTKGAAGTTGTAGTAGGAGTTGAAGSGAPDGGAAGTGGVADGGADVAGLPKFSFFVTSIDAMRALSGSQNGFGGNLSYGGSMGLAGADKICTAVAERGMPGAGAKTWRAFLSATKGGASGAAVNAIDRVGSGPWYDRLGRVVAMTKADLQQTRPRNADTAIGNDLPNETGTPNRQGLDNHDTLTGSNNMGMLQGTTMGATCNDWTSAAGNTGKPQIGHSWPAQSGQSWLQSHTAPGCAPGVNVNGSGPAPAGSDYVGAGGGYGGIYCFALTP